MGQLISARVAEEGTCKMAAEKSESPKVQLMRARLRAAELRVDAAHHDSSGYHRTAAKPLYAGQEEVCMHKAGIVDSLKAEKLAQADLVEAEAEEAYKATTGEEAPKC